MCDIHVRYTYPSLSFLFSIHTFYFLQVGNLQNSEGEEEGQHENHEKAEDELKRGADAEVVGE